MINITGKHECCGCGACAQRCPKQCITMQEDNEGFLYPNIDTSLCIDCGLCEKVCPQINIIPQKLPLTVLGAKNRDRDTVIRSSSGGIFTYLSHKIFSQGGVVFGARFDEVWDVVHGYAENPEQLRPFLKSKYVQSRIGDTFLKAESFLKEGRTVMFTGTPCQIKALKLFLRKDYPNLLAVDVACHSVPSPKVWKKYLTGILSENGITLEEVEAIDFRDKRDGWEKYSFTVRHRNGEIVCPGRTSVYMRAFLSGLTTRPSCASCKSKQGSSGSDLTIADFWGADTISPAFYDRNGTGLVLVNTEKGRQYLASGGIDTVETDFSEVIRYNGGIKGPVPSNPLREAYFDRFDKTVSFLSYTERYLRMTEAAQHAQSRKKTKIGIITLPVHSNIGGILQAYALQRVLRELGNDVETIDLNPVRRFGKCYFLRRLPKFLIGKKVDLFAKRKEEHLYAVKTLNTSRFVNAHIRRRVIDKFRTIKPGDYDICFVGSDQIWRPAYNPELEESYLSFTQGWNVKRVAYAASFGTDSWEYSDEQTERCSRFAKQFDAISVREDSAVSLCLDRLGVKSVTVLDPTMLLTKEDYMKLIPSGLLSADSRTLMAYVLDKSTEKNSIQRQICGSLNLEIDDKTTDADNNAAPVESRTQISVEEWLSGFANASFVFTDSFHGCVFSIIFNKPFAVYQNRDRGTARFRSLLRMFGLEDRIIDSEANICRIISTPINWDNVNRVLDSRRDLSYKYITDNI